MHKRFPRLLVVFVDGGYKRGVIEWAKAMFFLTLEVVKRCDSGKFKILPKRWIVERTFAWMDCYRINSKDYCHNPKIAEATAYATSINIMLKKLRNT